MPDVDSQRRFALEIVQRLRARGFVALWAGGCVRDASLGLAPKDYDVATSALPEEIREVFGRRRTIPVGAAFGVISVIGPKEAGQVDVVTFRSDGDYLDGRRPVSVSFSSPEEDARRRDFTINGMFFDPVAETLIDFVGGQDDLRRGVVRAIGDADQRFAEDKLRMLRAVRFAQTFGFSIEEATLRAVKRMAPQISVVSVERVVLELRRMLAHRARALGMELLLATGLLPGVLPELEPMALDGGSGGGHWRRALDTLARLEGQPSLPLALSALLSEAVAGDAALPQRLSKRLKLANKDERRLLWLVEHRDALVPCGPWPRLQRLLIEPGIHELLALATARVLAVGGSLTELEQCARLLELPGAELDPPPLLTGDDLVAHGIKPGKGFAALLEAIRDAQLERRIATKPEALALADQWVQQAGQP
jgi:poly(A) polymerase